LHLLRPLLLLLLPLLLQLLLRLQALEHAAAAVPLQDAAQMLLGSCMVLQVLLLAGNRQDASLA
jgi:hypothetical protein